MNRRQFLRFASVPIAAAVAIPELARTIFLPPRGGWPVDYVKRYMYQTYALGFAVTDDHVVLPGLPDRFSNKLIPPSEMVRILQEGLEGVFRRAYEEEAVDEYGHRYKFRERYLALYDSDVDGRKVT